MTTPPAANTLKNIPFHHDQIATLHKRTDRTMPVTVRSSLKWVPLALRGLNGDWPFSCSSFPGTLHMVLPCSFAHPSPLPLPSHWPHTAPSFSLFSRVSSRRTVPLLQTRSTSDWGMAYIRAREHSPLFLFSRDISFSTIPSVPAASLVPLGPQSPLTKPATAKTGDCAGLPKETAPFSRGDCVATPANSPLYTKMPGRNIPTRRNLFLHNPCWAPPSL
jgi:hypothetical protein